MLQPMRMHCVYLLRSIPDPGKRYIGQTSDLKRRLDRHNKGSSPHTAKHRPWQLVTYLAFEQKDQAIAFETYLKSGSGQAFANRRLW